MTAHKVDNLLNFLSFAHRHAATEGQKAASSPTAATDFQ